MTDCIFCKIAQGVIPTQYLFEDEHVVAFRDINPQAPVHVLIIPRHHISNITEQAAIEPNLLSSAFKAVQELVHSLNLKGGFRVVVNCGKDGGQTVGHLHFHLLGGRTMAWPPG